MLFFAIVLGLQIIGAYVYTTRVWYRHRIKGSGSLAVVFWLMAMRRSLSVVHDQNPSSTMYVIELGVIPFLISAIFVVSVVQIARDLEDRIRSAQDLERRLSEKAADLGVFDA